MGLQKSRAELPGNVESTYDGQICVIIGLLLMAVVTYD